MEKLSNRKRRPSLRQEAPRERPDSTAEKREAELTRMAVNEIQSEIKRAAERAGEIGPSGWRPCPLRKTNKRFLSATLRSVLTHNERKVVQTKQKALYEMKDHNRGTRILSVEKFGPRKYYYHHNKDSDTAGRDKVDQTIVKSSKASERGRPHATKRRKDK